MKNNRTIICCDCKIKTSATGSRQIMCPSCAAIREKKQRKKQRSQYKRSGRRPMSPQAKAAKAARRKAYRITPEGRAAARRYMRKYMARRAQIFNDLRQWKESQEAFFQTLAMANAVQKAI